MIEATTKNKGGRPRKWVNRIQSSIYVGSDELALITAAAEATGQSLNSFLVNCALAEARALSAPIRPTIDDALNLREAVIG